jgi:HK97 family phage major capsid protein
MNDVARDMNIIGTQEFRNAGINPEGAIILPNAYERANILAGSATAGQEIVAEDKKAILPPLVDKLIFSQAGATFMPGLVGSVSIPSYAGTSVAWKAEVTTAVDGGGAFSEVLLAPKRLTGFINVSKTFLAQDGVGAERLLLDNIANAVARLLEKTVLGPSTVHADYPSGIGYKINTANATTKAVLTGATLTWAKMVGIESSVDTANALQGNLAYMTNSTGRGILKTTDKGTSNDTGDYLMSEDNMINGYPCLVTNSIVSTYGTAGDGNMVVFGNWADLIIGQWGGYDITVDPYTAAKTNQVVIVINAYFDAKGLRGNGGTAGANLDEYYASFACESIK